MATAFRQELPPSGGYQKIDWVRQTGFKKSNGLRLLGLVLAAKVVGYTYYFNILENKRKLHLETMDARIATSPLLLAESDRKYLKYLRAVREEEAILMKDVPGWEVGKSYGQPVFLTKDENDLNTISHQEMSIFSNSVNSRGNIRHSPFENPLSSVSA